MVKLDVYDPAQCCATGACSPDVDDELAQFASALEWLKTQGVQVNRYNLGHQPGAFAQNPMVRGALEREGVGVLPLVAVGDRVISKGRYPSRAELARELSLDSSVGVTAAGCGRTAGNNGCCG
ncbi:MAG: arsenite efflux transporter metallochaperone ArsD [Pseudomonadota bacterium]